MNASPLRIGIAGLGTVGRGTLKVLGANADLLTARAGRELRPVAVSARDKTKDRGVPLGACAGMTTRWRWPTIPTST